MQLAGSALVTAALGAPQAVAQRGDLAPGPTKIDVKAEPLSGFATRDSARKRFGALEFRGGLVLTSDAKDFGGISSIRVERDGKRFLAVTDKGRWLRGRIDYQGDKPSGIADVEIAPILGADGKPMPRRYYDSESLAESGGTVWVGYERVHQIFRFDYGKQGLLARGQPVRMPPETKKMPSNKGIEGLVAVPPGLPLAGTLIALSEKALDENGNILGYLIGGKSPGSFAIKRIGEFDITDAALTPAGDLLILERAFSFLRGAGMRIRRVSLSAVQPGALLDGPVLIEADWSFNIDNMECLSVHAGDKGETVLTIVSDDNFSSWQRTLLLQFTLIEP
nr:esterase-like activity of phytase family protein [Variibacter gotjawalensis]